MEPLAPGFDSSLNADGLIIVYSLHGQDGVDSCQDQNNKFYKIKAVRYFYNMVPVPVPR